MIYPDKTFSLHCEPGKVMRNHHSKVTMKAQGSNGVLNEKVLDTRIIPSHVKNKTLNLDRLVVKGVKVSLNDKRVIERPCRVI